MTGSPMGLVTKILTAEPQLSIPTPIEELAKRLDITEIAELNTEGFEGGLITNEERTSGIILVNKNSTRERRKFTIAHELGHFLIPSHKPVKAGEFLCNREAMYSWDLKDQKRYMQMEAEANLFASLVLMPPPYLRAFLKSYKKVDIAAIIAVATHFQVSVEAAARAYVDYHGDPLAVIIADGSIVLRTYRSREFPFITVPNKTLIPQGSNIHSSRSSTIQGCEPDVWFDKTGATVSEQIHRNGKWSLILLKAYLPNEEDNDVEEDMTSAQRLKFREAQSFGR